MKLAVCTMVQLLCLVIIGTNFAFSSPVSYAATFSILGLNHLISSVVQVISVSDFPVLGAGVRDPASTLGSSMVTSPLDTIKKSDFKDVNKVAPEPAATSDH